MDLISGTITRYFLNDETWAKKDSKTFSKSIVTNGPVYTWRVQKWGVKEKFEYNITVKDNGKSHKYDNINKHILSRYNFEAKPYDSFSANGGQRHHFIASAALSKNNFNSRKAYCIRMMAADHRKTGSYGSAAYVNQVSDLLKNKKYEEALQKEVDDFKSNNDTEGIAGSLQQKYYNEVVICLANYTKLFGI